MTVKDKPNEPLRFTKTKDKYGCVWATRPSKYSHTNELEIWADRADRQGERFVLRQENATKVDLITVDLGQAYDIIRALSEALDSND
jgi:hypothetical protein